MKRIRALIAVGKFSEAFEIASSQSCDMKIATLFEIGKAVVKVKKPNLLQRRCDLLKRAVNALMQLGGVNEARILLVEIDDQPWVTAMCRTIDSTIESQTPPEIPDMPVV